ncbi:Alpha/beta hydrolase family protein [Gemmata sp. SH-PL17]|uniref:esterase/lipase family protein n=1 Tax=Gemmata sp. SH-PL17 TaxID=1630693 RepID=UPI0004BA68C5|nr:alpha/beta fold hydrolase [Gemmata sp. SH-PL17]AMV27672.1 Alpha/beta hydrolase family protein [Gemmata sp. SH-PL17]
MTSTLFAIALITSAPVPIPEPSTELWQVAPGTSAKVWTVTDKPSEKKRALVLIPGLHVHPLRPAKATKPELRDWQQPKSELVKALAKDFDVFAFGYSQTISADEVAQGPGLRDTVANLRKSGYTEIVLVGHSAGGVIGRQFVEQNPDAGVTRLIAIAAPFAGAEAATLNVGYPKVQAPFVKSLAPEARKEAMRGNKFALNADTEFACVVCRLKRGDTDGVVLVRSQWPEDLQQLGIPAVIAPVSHFDAMDNATTAKTILELAKGKLTRWSTEEVDTARKILFAEQPARSNFLRRQAK